MSSSAPRPRAWGACRRAQSGDLLIEVLIAVLVLGIGLLGIAAMQATALRNSHSALQRGQAATQLHAILDAMRANPAGVSASGYALSRTCTVPTAGGSLAGNDLSAWIAALHDTLGSTACGTVTCTGTTTSGITSHVCTVTVEWDDGRASDAGSDGIANGDSAYALSASARL